MMAQQRNLDTISNNLANSNTTAYKSLRAEFQDLVYETFRGSGSSTGSSINAPTPIQVGSGSRFSANAVNLNTGTLNNTGNTFDIAIQGDGYFQVQRADGSTAYTRDGSFQRDNEGKLVTSDGYHLLPDITIPAGTTSISIAPGGQISGVAVGASDATSLGTITLATFANPAGLTRIGQNLFTAGGASGDAKVGNPGENGAGTLQSGFLEGSNVSVVDEMVNMISAQRAYELNSKAIQTADEMLSVISQLKR